MSKKEKPIVFISYSHKDEKWKDLLIPHLKTYQNLGHLDVWDDRRIQHGQDWHDEIKEAMEKASFAICLISADFFASEFIFNEEIPYLLEKRKNEGMPILPVLIRQCGWDAIPWLKRIQMFPRDSKCVAKDYLGNEDEVFNDVAKNIHNLATDPAFTLPSPSITSEYPAIEESKIDLTRLPQSGSELFGRSKELQFLTQSWDEGDLNITTLVAYGGVGKTTLVNRWLEQMALENFRGASRVFGWSFYSQGTGERVTSADQFISASLKWFGDREPEKGSAWDKGLRLAKLVREQRTLLILDGLEPLQSEHEKGKIKDPALSVLVRELAKKNSGLCVITIREEVTEIKKVEAVKEKSLEEISAQAGRALLRVSGVRGTDQELEHISERFGNHALTIQLLASWLYGIKGHEASHALEINLPKKGKSQKEIFAAVAEALDKQLANTPEGELAQLMGLFDRPVEDTAVQTFIQKPAIPGLTDLLSELPPVEMEKTKARARQKKLLLPESVHTPQITDAHPLIREYYGERLEQEKKGAWEEAHLRLYAHYKATARELPETMEEMAPLSTLLLHTDARQANTRRPLSKCTGKRSKGKRNISTQKNLALTAPDSRSSPPFSPPPGTRPNRGSGKGTRPLS